MTSNSNLKQQARAYAAAHGVSYTQARREILAAESGRGPGGAGPGVRRMLTIQQEDRADGTRPYPFHVDAHGFVDRQDFWRGSPFRLIGFAADPGVHQVTVDVADWVAAPESVLGMHPVLVDRRTGVFYTYEGPVVSVREFSARAVPAAEVTVRVRTTDGRFDLTVGVGHLMWLLNVRDFDGSPGLGLVLAGAAREMLGWLLVDDGGQDITGLHAMYSHLDDRDGELADLVVVEMDRAQVQAWVASGSRW